MTSSLVVSTLAFATALVVACSSAPEETGEVPIAGCTLEFLGDRDKPIEMELVYLDAEDALHPLEDGATLPMIVPPQGGWVVFVGARATNVDPCGLTIKGVLRDPGNEQVRVDERTTRLEPLGDGWGGPIEGDISTFSNVPTCPNQWASVDLPGNPIELTYAMTDRGGRTAKRTITVVPECAEAAFKNSCSCQCRANYVLGESCFTE
jgi:hypothetical protein